MFPAITDAWRTFRAGLGTDIQGLDLKQENITFDPVNADWLSRNGYPQIRAALGGGMPGWSGEPVSLSTALNHSVAFACNRIISESVGFLPLSMMQEKNGTRLAAKDKPLYRGLHNAPNDEMSTMEFRESRTSHAVMQGNGYAKIERRSGTGVAMELYPLDPGQVIKIDRDSKQRLVYHIKDGNAAEQTFTIIPGKPQDILHLRGIGSDGVMGYSVISMARQSIGTALSAEKYAAKFYANGGRVPYVLMMPQKFRTDEDYNKFRADWEKVYAEPHRAPILDNGMEYKQIGMSSADAQFLETRQFNIPEICRWFSVSPHLVGDLSRATFSNIEQLALEFVKMTLMAWLTRWEQDLWRCVLTPDEKASGYYFKHNVNALLRGDFVSRMQGYASALQNGHLSIDEVRALEDMNALPDGIGADYHIQLNMQDVANAGQPQPASLMKVGSKASPRIEEKQAPSQTFNVSIQPPNVEVNAPPTTVNIAAAKPPQVLAPVNLNMALTGRKRQVVKRDAKGLLTSIDTEEDSINMALPGRRKHIIKRDAKGLLTSIETEEDNTEIPIVNVALGGKKTNAKSIAGDDNG